MLWCLGEIGQRDSGRLDSDCFPFGDLGVAYNLELVVACFGKITVVAVVCLRAYFALIELFVDQAAITDLATDIEMPQG